MLFPRKQLTDNKHLPSGYDLGYAAGEKACAQAIMFAHSYIEILERQVKTLTEQLNNANTQSEQCDNKCEDIDN